MERPAEVVRRRMIDMAELGGGNGPLRGTVRGGGSSKRMTTADADMESTGITERVDEQRNARETTEAATKINRTAAEAK